VSKRVRELASGMEMSDLRSQTCTASIIMYPPQNIDVILRLHNMVVICNSYHCK
jgi:hypothetical protein